MHVRGRPVRVVLYSRGSSGHGRSMQVNRTECYITQQKGEGSLLERSSEENRSDRSKTKEMIRKEKKKRERKRGEERIGIDSKERNRTDWNYAMKIKKGR